jgi:hypothetical protein
MSATDWIALIGIMLGGGGGGAAISKLTRLAVAVEGLVESMKKVHDSVAGHETRIATLEGRHQATRP